MNTILTTIILSIVLSSQIFAAAPTDDQIRVRREALDYFRKHPQDTPGAAKAVIFPGVHAAPPANSGEVDKVKNAIDEKKDSDSGKLPSPTDILGRIDWGAGLAVTIDVGSRQRVKRASLDAGNVIRIEADDDIQVGAILETHFRLFERPLGESLKWETGIFVGMKPGEDFIDALGVGLLMGFQRGAVVEVKTDEPLAKVQPGALTLGVGVMIDPNVQVLGDGLKANQAVAAGTQIRFKETTQVGVICFLGFSY